MTEPNKKQRAKPWYASYDELSIKVEELRSQYIDRCRRIGANPEQALTEIRREIIARSVHESNWQEGIYLDQGRTRELADAAFERMPAISGPHIDLDGLVDSHQEDVSRMKEQGAPLEEIAAFNLARAHIALDFIGYELGGRQTALLCKALNELIGELRKKPNEESAKQVRDFELIVTQLRNSKYKLPAPYTGEIKTEGELFDQWIKLDTPDLSHPMHVSYIHFLHRITMMGILPKNKCGTFRKNPVHIGSRDLYFPPPSALDGLMEEYCEQFPSLLPNVFKDHPKMKDVKIDYNPILKSAQASYRFVLIHPYADGNGRISRLLMNLVFWRRFQPVYLKADKKGRHRYGYALRRADKTGDTKPLASLIALSLTEVYTHLLKALNPLNPSL